MFSLIGYLWGLCWQNAAGRSVRGYLGCIKIWMHGKSLTRSIPAKQRPSANIWLAGSQLSVGYSNEKHTRSATPRALTRSYVNAGTTKNNQHKARSLFKQLRQKWGSNSILWRQGKMLNPKWIVIRHLWSPHTNSSLYMFFKDVKYGLTYLNTFWPKRRRKGVDCVFEAPDRRRMISLQLLQKTAWQRNAPCHGYHM